MAHNIETMSHRARYTHESGWREKKNTKEEDEKNNNIDQKTKKLARGNHGEKPTNETELENGK